MITYLEVLGCIAATLLVGGLCFIVYLMVREAFE